MKNTILAMIAWWLSFAPMWAQEVNYDESKIPPYTLEDPLKFVDGRKVRNAKDWELRREEILGIFQREMYGQMPPKSPITTEILEEGITLAGFGIRRQVRMWFRSDKTGPKVDWLIITPRYVKEAVPTIIFLNYNGNQTLLEDKEILLTDGWIRDEEGMSVNHKAIESTRGYYAGQSSDSVYPIGMLIGYYIVKAEPAVFKYI